MKFVIVAVVVLALAMSVQSSVLPLGIGLGLGHRLDVAGHGLSYTAVSGPALVPQVVGLSALGLPSVAVHAGIPAAVAVSPHAVAVAPHVVAGGTYVAQTRGASHVAPLAGHINSVSSVNVAPAPGTL
ncbi:adult cuticle protein 1-like [Episyrphus balteatus]|uniref:adult cuticle protein 1-like n=1 Tax=Episyrphus balteatus TaxID=286459 RepID=UPI00248697DF|nr:adult cuticle protein 1-like [Episyrphus balteatus]